jgi:hypothetical protein
MTRLRAVADRYPGGAVMVFGDALGLCRYFSLAA